MYRPIGLFENSYSFLLMKNRHEEWGEIPKEYVDSVVYKQGELTQMTINIPDKVSYMNREVDNDLYNDIRGKMQIIMNINGVLSRFIIDDKISVKNTKNGNTKTVVAYSFEKTLEKKNFTNAEGMTRQLYRSPDESVEVGEGILNLFEQKTNFKIGHVDELAKKESGLYETTNTLTLFNNLTVDNIEKESLIWSKEVSVDIGDLPLTFTIAYTDMESYSEKLLQKKESISHTFNNLPYGLKKIEAYYISSAEYRFGMKYVVTYSNDEKKDFYFDFANVHKLKVVFPTIELTHNTGNYEEKLNTKYRYFEADCCSWTTMLERIEEAFECIIEFDTYNQVVNIYDKDSFGEDTGIVINYENAIKEINKSQKVGDIVTRLYVNSPNVSIAEENPLGTEYVEDYSYFMENGIMSNDLIQALKQYNEVLEVKNTEFLGYKVTKNSINQLLIKRQSELIALQEKYKVENAILSAYIKENNTDKQSAQSEVVTDLEKQITEMLATIQDLTNQSDDLLAKMTQIGVDIKKENVSYNGQKIFNQDLLDELEDYVIESSITNDYYTLAYTLYQHALEVIKDMNLLYIDFTMTTYDFLNRIVVPDEWNQHIKIGSRFKLDTEHSDLLDEEGNIQLYGFTFTPNTADGFGNVSNLSFTNNKEPKQTAIKTIADTAKKANQVSNMTNFWKETWKASANNNIAVEELLQNGLDVSAQVVRGKGTINKIDISESGIYVIDAEDENKQIYYGSGLIAITTDKWRSSQLAIDSSGICAETLVGRVILGAKLEIGNADNTFVINPHGMSVYDANSSQSERIFIGIENGQATFRLMSKDGSNKLVLSEDGIYQVFPVQARDSFDNQNSFKINFYLPSSLQRLDEAILNFNLEKFRTYSKGSVANSQVVQTATTSTLDGYSKTSSSGGGTNKNKTSSSGGYKYINETSASDGGYSDTKTSAAGGYKPMNPTSTTKIITTSRTTRPDASANNDPGNIDIWTHSHAVKIPDHNHNVSFTIPNHTHNVTINVPKHTHKITATIPAHTHDFAIVTDPHTHKVDISGHSHTVKVTIPSHNHDIVHGIYDYPNLATCSIYIDGTLVADNVAGDRNINIAPYLKKPYGGTHTFEVRSKSTTANPNGLGRANVSMFITGFVSF